jgi:agmatine deiminase
MTNRWPAEWEQHTRTWMAWPSSGYALGDSEADIAEARGAWASVANAIVKHEPVTMIVDPSAADVAREWLDDRVAIVEAKLDDAWMRDIGPTFVRAPEGTLLGVNWIFNGWGDQSWAEWTNDAEIGRAVLASADVPVISSTLTNEGGGIHTNGDGTVLVTETVQLDPGRNPGWTREQVERELFDTLGATRFVWLPRGLTRDYDEFGTRGHVDIVAAFCNPTTVLYHDQRNPEHPDFAVSEEVRTILEAEGFELIAVPAPETLRDDEGFVDYSYINHYVCNGAVILCGFDDPNDEVAKGILEKAYPGRTVELVDARALFARGGGIHCITQQQPA